MSKRIPLAGVIGQPIEHSLSPRLHGHWLKRYGIQGHYIPMNIRHEDLERVLRTLPAMGFIGLNVTIPHKEAVLALADLSSDRAALIGAANTLIFREDGKIHADNTDGYGFVANLRQYAPDWQPSDGGAAVICISQDLDELMEIADRFAALNEGRLTAPRPTAGLTIDEIGLMMGGAHGMEDAHV